MERIESHYSAPLVILMPLKEGFLYGIDLTNPRKPNMWPPIKLQRESFSWMSYLMNTDFTVVSSRDQNKLTLIKVRITT